MKKFIEKLKHAFKIEDEKFTDEELQLLDTMAKEVVRRKLETPAILFLESLRPLNYLGSQAMVFFEPIVSIAVPTNKYNMVAKVLERRSFVQVLIDKIESYSASSKDKKPWRC